MKAVTPFLPTWATGLMARGSAGGVVRAIMPCLLIVNRWTACARAGVLAAFDASRRYCWLSVCVCMVYLTLATKW